MEHLEDLGAIECPTCTLREWEHRYGWPNNRVIRAGELEACAKVRRVVRLGPVAEARRDPTTTYVLTCGHTTI